MADDILIVDDEADIRELVSGILQDEGFITRSARDSDDALAHVASRRPNLVFLDIWLQGSRLDGLQLLDAMKAQHPELPIVMISGHGNIETAVAAIKQGAYDFIEKPFKADRLVLVAQRALETSRLKREVKALKQLAPSNLVGKSPSINQLRGTVEKISPTNSRILIVGPAGAGKELAARAVHSHSSRANGPFIVINAAAMMPERMEVELFGVEQPADGQARKVGALEEAHGGTLFIDEIADMPRETQNKILRVLVEQTFQRVGGTNKVQVDVRIISSTGRNIETEIAAGRFREDLYHRLSVVPVRVPPLAERREDIPDLVHYFMEQISIATGLPKRMMGEDAMAVLQHDLAVIRNVCDRIYVMYAGQVVEHGPAAQVFAAPKHPYTQALVDSVLDPWEAKKEVTVLPGAPPDMASPPPGCRFHPRCRFAMDACARKEPTNHQLGGGQEAKCWLHAPAGAIT